MGQEVSSSQDLTFFEETLFLPGFFIASLILLLDYKGVHPHQETFFSLPIWTPHQSPERYGLLLHDGRRCSTRTGNLLPHSQLDQLSPQFPGEELTSPRSPFASLSDHSW
jgi:hypothetical protein